MFCPLAKSNCLGRRCALWINEEYDDARDGVCSIKSIAEAINCLEETIHDSTHEILESVDYIGACVSELEI